MTDCLVLDEDQYIMIDFGNTAVIEHKGVKYVGHYLIDVKKNGKNYMIYAAPDQNMILLLESEE